jgi:hypothetical protein
MLVNLTYRKLSVSSAVGGESSGSCVVLLRYAGDCKRPTDLLENINLGLRLGSTVSIVPPAVDESL